MSEYKFKDDNEYGQAAFDSVAHVVSKFAEQVLFEGNLAPNSDQCLQHLELVASQWGFNPARITALKEIVSEGNAELKEMLIHLGDHDD